MKCATNSALVRTKQKFSLSSFHSVFADQKNQNGVVFPLSTRNHNTVVRFKDCGQKQTRSACISRTLLLVKLVSLKRGRRHTGEWSLKLITLWTRQCTELMGPTSTCVTLRSDNVMVRPKRAEVLWGVGETEIVKFRTRAEAAQAHSEKLLWCRQAYVYRIRWITFGLHSAVATPPDKITYKRYRSRGQRTALNCWRADMERASRQQRAITYASPDVTILSSRTVARQQWRCIYRHDRVLTGTVAGAGLKWSER